MMIEDKIIDLWDQIREGTIETINKFTDQDLAFNAFEGGYSVGEIIHHIAQEEFGEIQYGLTYKLDNFPSHFGDEDYKTIDSLQELLSNTHDETLDYLRSLTDSELKDEFEAQWGERKPLVDFVIHVIEHEIHHRGELSLILGLLGREGFDA
jgi:uncharacterized damage-inducible protein DinB